jgi:hypothetical protein
VEGRVQRGSGLQELLHITGALPRFRQQVFAFADTVRALQRHACMAGDGF